MTSDSWSDWSEPELRHRIRCLVLIDTAPSGLVRSENIGVVHSLLRDTVPWVTFLSEADVDVFVTELLTIARRAIELGNPGPIDVLLTQWRQSAEVYADPALLEILTAAPEGDPGSVSAPSGKE